MSEALKKIEPANQSFDIDRIRADFPILARPIYDDKPLTYLDNAASAQKPQVVIDRITKAYSEEYANVHRGLHYLSNTATQAFEDARESVRRFLNAPTDRYDATTSWPGCCKRIALASLTISINSCLLLATSWSLADSSS